MPVRIKACGGYYGVPITVDFDEYYEAKEEEFLDENPGGEYIKELENAFEHDQDGFLTYYSGNGDVTPKAFGVYISEFNECFYSLDVSQLKLTPTPEMIAQYNKNYAALSQDLKDEIDSFGKPRAFILWTTS